MRLPERIPPLSGGWLAAYRVLWGATFVLAMIGSTFANHANIERNRAFNEATYRAGILAGEMEGQRRVSPTSPAKAAAGIQPDSILLAIDGKRWPASVSTEEARALTRALSGAEGERHRLTVRSPEGRISTVSLAVRQANLAAFDDRAPISLANRFAILTFVQYLTAALFLSASVLLFLRRAREPVVALLSLGFVVGAAQAGLAFLSSTELPDAIQAFNLESVLIGASLALFPSGRFEPRWTLLVVASILVAGVTRTWGNYGLNLAWALANIVAIVMANLVRFRRLGSSVERQQIKWATLGIAGALAFYSANYVCGFLQTLTEDAVTSATLSVSANVFRILGTVTLTAGLLVSLLRYRLYDAESVLSRSAVYGVLGIAMIVVFTATEKLIELLAHEYGGEEMGTAAAALSAGLAAAVIPVFHHRLERWAERRFQGPLLAIRDKLPQDLRDWRETEPDSEIAQLALERITAALRSRDGAVIRRAGRDIVLAGQVADDADMPLQIPLGPLPDGGEGLLLLGPRPDGSPPGKDEREAAQAIADPLGRALAVAQRRHAHGRALQDTLAALAARIARLEKRRSGASA